MANQPSYSGRSGPNDRQLRAGDAERETVTEILRAEHLAGRIDDDEFDERLARCLTARTYADLDALIADLRGAEAPRPSPRRLVRLPPSRAFLMLPLICLAIAFSHGRAVWLLVPLFWLIMRSAAWRYRSEYGCHRWTSGGRRT